MKQIDWEKGMRFFGGAGFMHFEKSDLEPILPNYDYGHAFAYLWRRFGPPIVGCDPYKDLTTYHLTTKIEGVYLSCKCYLTSHIAFGFGFSHKVWQEIDAEINKPRKEWLEGTLAIFDALLEAIEELRRPVNVRDWFINIEGKVKDCNIVDPVEYSPKAGYGVSDEYYERFKKQE